MKTILLQISLLFSIVTFGQKSDIENIVNQILAEETQEKFEYYYLHSKSLEQPKVTDLLQNYQIRDFKKKDENFPVKLYYEEKKEIIDWKNYELKAVEYLPSDTIYRKLPPRSKNVMLVKYNIGQKEYDSIVKNRKPHTIVVKKKKIWNKNGIWTNKKFRNELEKAWKINKDINPEEELWFEVSKPIFTESMEYAKVSVFKNQPCKGTGFTAIYKSENGKWTKVYEYRYPSKIVVDVSHSKCEDISISMYE